MSQHYCTFFLVDGSWVSELLSDSDTQKSTRINLEVFPGFYKCVVPSWYLTLLGGVVDARQIQEILWLRLIFLWSYHISRNYHTMEQYRGASFGEQNLKVFLRSGEMVETDGKKAEMLSNVATTIQRRDLIAMETAAVTIQKYWRGTGFRKKCSFYIFV